MENTEYLKYFINEDLYQVEEKEQANVKKPDTQIKQEGEISIPQSVQVVEEPVEKLASPELIPYKGDNKKGILILVEDVNAEFLNEKDLTYLLKIIGAVKLSLEDIALVNVDKTMKYASLEFTKAVVFTSNHALEIDDLQKYAEIHVDGRKLLMADPLDQIASSVELRTNLWNALKEMFKA